ncbi:MAG: hypothetical protein LBD27_07470 [Tannerella sp.]|nr:hypothetical protein [Tannerella sp.]
MPSQTQCGNLDGATLGEGMRTCQPHPVRDVPQKGCRPALANDIRIVNAVETHTLRASLQTIAAPSTP